MRLGTANTYDNTLANLTTRQSDLADLQEKLSAGKRVVRASDDPTGAAQAERAWTRSARIETEQRVLSVQKNSMSMAESTLGDATGLLQNIRDLVISAGNGAYNGVNRTSIAEQMRQLREELASYANKQDSNGMPLFGGLGSLTAPFIDVVTATGPNGVSFQGMPGQRASTTVSIPSTMDGQSTWMDVPTGNGVFKVGLGTSATPNTGTVTTDIGQVINPSAVTSHNYSVTFNVVAGVTTFDVFDDTLDPTHVSPALLAAQPYTEGQAIQFDGLSFAVHGTPANLDTLQITPSTKTSLFTVLDSAIANINGAGNSAALTQALAYATTEIDAGMARVQAARGLAGDLLNRAEHIDNNQQTKTVQLAADRSRAEDMDMVKGISEFQNRQTGYDAALRTYAQVQKLSLFNYLG